MKCDFAGTNVVPVILCGGKGSRLWPLSRELSPKQFLRFDDDLTLFQQAVERTKPFGNPPLVLCNNENRFLATEQLSEIGVGASIVLEPEARDTAPAIAVSALLNLENDPCLLILPADHKIPEQDSFNTSMERAVALAEQGYLVTFGVKPDHPETGYGYIKTGAPLLDGFKVVEFVEKPDEATAKGYLDDGSYLWNSGMFVVKASVLLEEYERYSSEILAACQRAVEAARRDLDFIRLGEEAFASSPALSFDYAIAEKTDRCAIVALESAWSDLGSWKALFETGVKNGDGNVVTGDVVAMDTRNSYLKAETRFLATVGIDDAVVIETKDAVLVARKDKVQHVKQIVSELKKNDRDEAAHHKKVYRPWGAYESTDVGEGFQVKRITVKPGQILSLQMHHHRAEHWIVVRGTAKITSADKEFLLTEDQSTYIPQGTVHRLENPGKIPLELIEVQTGCYLGEDDIVRLEDIYSRVD